MRCFSFTLLQKTGRFDAGIDHKQSMSVLEGSERVQGQSTKSTSSVLSAAGVRAHYVWKLPLDVSCCPRLGALWPSFERGTWPSDWGLNTAVLKAHTVLLFSTVLRQRKRSLTVLKQWKQMKHDFCVFLCVSDVCVCVLTVKHEGGAATWDTSRLISLHCPT